MTTLFVDSAAVGANNGTSWADAWTSIASATGVAAGDVIHVDDGHSQSAGASLTLTFTNGTITNPIKIFCVDKNNSDALSTGAIVTTGAGNFTLAINGNLISSGMSWKTGRFLQLNGTTQQRQLHENCIFSVDGASAIACTWFIATTDLVFTRLVNCTIDKSSTTNDIVMIQLSGSGPVVEVVGCTFTPGSVDTTVYSNSGGSRNEHLTILDCDLSAFSVLALINHATNWPTMIVRRCKVHASMTITRTSITTGLFISVENCDDGTISVPALGLTQYERYEGTIKATLARYRSDGATDGLQANPYAWELVSGTNA
jgi:hypothetical protein